MTDHGAADYPSDQDKRVWLEVSWGMNNIFGTVGALFAVGRLR